MIKQKQNKLTNTQARELAYRMLFSNQFNDLGFDEEIFGNLLAELQTPEEVLVCSQDKLDFIKSLVLGVQEHYDELREIICAHTEGYTFDRIVYADRVALMLAVYEIKFTNLDFKIATNEAINLVKKYSTDKSYRFVNSVLKKINLGNSNE